MSYRTLVSYGKSYATLTLCRIGWPPLDSAKITITTPNGPQPIQNFQKFSLTVSLYYQILNVEKSDFLSIMRGVRHGKVEFGDVVFKVMQGCEII